MPYKLGHLIVIAELPGGVCYSAILRIVAAYVPIDTDDTTHICIIILLPYILLEHSLAHCFLEKAREHEHLQIQRTDISLTYFHVEHIQTTLSAQHIVKEIIRFTATVKETGSNLKLNLAISDKTHQIAGLIDIAIILHDLHILQVTMALTERLRPYQDVRPVVCEKLSDCVGGKMPQE